MREPDHDDDVDDNENNDDDNDECVPPALSWRSCHHEHSHWCRTCLHTYQNPISKIEKIIPFIVSCPISCNVNATAVELRKNIIVKKAKTAIRKCICKNIQI